MKHLLFTTLCVLSLGNYTFAQVNGNWGTWTDWSSCSETCNVGNRTRTRECDNPAPSGGGTQCTGVNNETLTCIIMNYCIPSYYGNTDQGCSADNFGCASGVTACINMTQRCDQNIDCEDGSDENPYFTNCTVTVCYNGTRDSHSTVYTSLLLVAVSCLFMMIKH